MIIPIPYGRGFYDLTVPDTVHVGKVGCEKQATGEINVGDLLKNALENPIGSPRLREMGRGKNDAVVVINDVTRPAPNKELLEVLLPELAEAGISQDRVTVVIATGNHRPTLDHEIREMVGTDLASRLRIIDHNSTDTDNLEIVGKTEDGAPITINKTVARASLKILTGLIAPHPSAGYSGGRKSILPGVSGIETLKRHHSFPFRPYHPAYGWMKGNPFHEEALRIARKAGVDFILNVVKDAEGRIVHAVAGDLEAAHERGVLEGKPHWEMVLPHKYDVVAASPGGYPRDIDLHQAQKAVSTAETVCKPGGTIVLIAQCPKGAGKWARWLKEADRPEDVIERFRKVGFNEDHTSKAFMFARASASFTLYVCCDGIQNDELEEMMFKTAKSPNDAMINAVLNAGPDARVLILPMAVNCVPVIADDLKGNI